MGFCRVIVQMLAYLLSLVHSILLHYGSCFLGKENNRLLLNKLGYTEYEVFKIRYNIRINVFQI